MCSKSKNENEKKPQVAGIVFKENIKTPLYIGGELLIFRYESGEIEIIQIDSRRRHWRTIIENK